MKLKQITGARDMVKHHVVLERPALYVTGPNESGKTTLLDLVAYGVTGPSRRAHPTLTEVDLVWDEFALWRQSGPEQDHQLRTSCPVMGPGSAPMSTSKIRDGETAIAARIGPLQVFDALALFAATPTERRRVLAPLMAPALAPDVVAAAFREAGVAYTQLPPLVQEHMQPDALRRITDGLEWGQTWLTQLRDAKNAMQARAERNRRAVDAAVDRLQRGGEAPPTSLDHWRLQLAEAEEALVRARTARDEQRHLHMAIAAAEARRDAATRAPQPNRAAMARANVATWERHLESVEAAVVRARAQRNEAAADADQAVHRLEKLETAAAAHEDAAAANRLRHLLVPLVALASAADAPEARQAATQVQALLDAQTRAPEELAAARTMVASTDRRTAVTHAALVQAEKVVGDTRATLQLARAAVDQAEHADAAERAALAAELEASQAAVADLPATTSRNALADAVTAAEARVQEVQGEVDRATRYDALVAERDSLLQLAKALADGRTQLHQLEKRAEEAFGVVLGRAAERLTTTASQITQATMGRPVTIDPANGWNLYLGQHLVEHLSESTTVILGASLHAAARLLLPGWRALLLDGLEVVEDVRRVRLVRALARAGLDNVIVAAVADGIVPRDDLVQLVQLRRVS